VGHPIANTFNNYLKRWDDATALASGTPRISLSGPLSQMQAVRRDAEAEPWPACARNAAQLMDTAMNSEINEDLAFMSNTYATSASRTQSRPQWTTFQNALKAIS
jgi:hypothetical protein